MNEHSHHESHTDDPIQAQGFGRGWAALAGFVAVAGFYLWAEHRAHLLGVLPYLILLACPFLHSFMHRGHGHGGNTKSGDGDGS